MNLRTATRVLVKVGSFPAVTFDDLFDGVKALPWSELIHPRAAFPVRGKSVRSALHSVPACQSVTKKAITAALGGGGNGGWIDEDPREGVVEVEVAVLEDMVTVSLDASGQALNRRGFRTGVLAQGAAPLKETLAAGMLALAGWDSRAPLYDPFCGSGTILLEAVRLTPSPLPARRPAPAPAARPPAPARHALAAEPLHKIVFVHRPCSRTTSPRACAGPDPPPPDPPAPTCAYEDGRPSCAVVAPETSERRRAVGRGFAAEDWAGVVTPSEWRAARDEAKSRVRRPGTVEVSLRARPASRPRPPRTAGLALRSAAPARALCTAFPSRLRSKTSAASPPQPSPPSAPPG